MFFYLKTSLYYSHESPTIVLPTGVSMVSYRVSINTSTPQKVSTNLTNVTLEGEYNTPLEIQLFAMNCAGNSTKVTLIVYQGMVCVATLVGEL